MSVVIHFIDNSTANINNGLNFGPYVKDSVISEDFVEVLGDGSIRIALIPVDQLKYAERTDV